MSTVQLVGVAAAAAVVLILLVALLVRRRGGADEALPADDEAAPLFAGGPRDEFDWLGQPEAPVEEVTRDPAVERHLEALATAAPAPGEADTGELPASIEEAPAGEEAGLEPLLDDEGDLVSDIPAEGGAGPAAVGPAEPAEGVASADQAAGESGPGGRLVPLSDIIVTTSKKMVDLDDPEVRRMLTDLVAYEIDQATLLQQQGQTVDALLQLTEAEKIATTLGMAESAARIREMMRELQKGV